MMSKHDNRTQSHFHIRWEDKLDWECFETREEASARAKELARPQEAYEIEMFDGQCPACGMLGSANSGAG